MSIRDILDELYKLDPALKSEEAELMKIIDKLMRGKPEAEPDEEFKIRFKSELIAMMDQKKKRKGFFLIHRKTVVGAAAGLAAALVLVLTLTIRPMMVDELKMSDKEEATQELYTGKSEQSQASEAVVLERAETADAPERTDAQKKTEKTIADKAVVINEVPGDEKFMEPAAPQTMKRSLAPDQGVMGFAMEAEAPVEWDSEIAAEDDFFMNQASSVEDFNTEEYSRIYENDFMMVNTDPLSTFSIDVDTASYSNVRRFINSGSLPLPDAVRIEELINYFSYDYRLPEGDLPFSFNAEFSDCPWNSGHRLLHVGLQGYTVEPDDIPQSNIVFLIDASGSMEDENKLPLLKKSMSLLIDTLRPMDRVSIVAYAGAAGLVLPPTPGNRKDEILSALDNLYAGGSTAGGAGIDLAYKVAADNMFKGGNNRVVLATDGDFNVGQSSEGELTRMIEERRDQGIFLTVLGLGMGNYKDSRMESLADKGNGNYAYIDTVNEARKVLVTEMSSTMFTIAKDVKIQIEFNPVEVESYRLIGYENRVMAAQDFDDDRKDAGEIGAGHSVTALYEIIPAEGSVGASALRYQSSTVIDTAGNSGELAFIKFRYKKPDEDLSILTQYPVSAAYISYDSTSENFRFSAAVAEWGMLLRNSGFKADADINNVIKTVRGALGQDEYGYRAEFLSLLYKTRELIQ